MITKLQEAIIVTEVGKEVLSQMEEQIKKKKKQEHDMLVRLRNSR